jgi:hypothetical protein
MDGCLNSLNDPVVFIPTAALLALVLMVLTQLHAGGRANNVNLVCGRAWIYLALLSALIAVAFFVHDNTSACAKGFLILSFFMTGIEIFILFLLNIARFRSRFEHSSGEEPPVESLLGECGWSRFCGLIWLAMLAGLLLISLSLVGIWFCRFLQDTVVCWSVPCSWQFIIGLVLVSSAVLAVIVIVCCRVWWECIWPKLKDRR